ncbi:MAG: tetratricopeptide repeat protein [Proteobacteria bacterium]|nr:tetratricopeptide repeat protein [Pseudomonadota bacterium]
MNGRNFCRILLMIISLLLWQSATSQAGVNEEQLFQQGNEAYSRGDHEQAIARYEKLVTASGLSPSVLFNLANSYAQAGKIGRAILNYERALRLAPGDSDISGNLELVRKESGLFADTPRGAAKVFHLLSLNQWAMLGLLALIAFTLFQAASIKFRLRTKTRIIVRIGCLMLLLIAAAGTAIRYQGFKPSVVIAADARLLISPFESATSVGAIQEGRLVFQQKDHGPFTYVRDETNRQGWILSSSLEAVVR